MTTESTLTIALHEARAEIQRLEEIKKTLSLQAAGLLSDIERLRVDLSDSSAEIVMNHTEIERLRDILKYERRESASIMPMAEEILCLKERIAELEDLAVLSGWQSLDGDLDGKYIITEAQIDAAWGSTLQHSDYEVVKRALAELGIERCGGCGGDGRIALDDVDGKYAEGPCPDCHGKGWIKT